ncbi:MAG: glycoside hydrolase family 38 C-terminal domain-containing protein [Acidimicrobiia bacterium]
MSATPPAPTNVSIVPHTHWDREWYAPFQTYRVQLVHLVDGLLDLMEGDASYTRFLLDGQTAVVDDYLEVRPEAADRLAELVTDGRLQVGPWMVLMDEFMISGETIVRDLQLGISRTRTLGGDATVGYLPDMFGHVAQMPQLLQLAGIDHAVVWRGVPAEIDRTAFWWDAPDGSRVRAEYLYGSYSNGRDLPRDPSLLVARARGYVAELGDAALPGGGLLLMNGSDHLVPQKHLGALVAAANDAQTDFRFAITSLAEHVARQPVDGLQTWRGELRSGARANVLMGVASNRVDVHQAAAAAERALERRAEPLSALFVDADQYPHRLLALAWRNLVLNSAHDSSCACSADEVVEAVRVRYQEARHIGEALSNVALTGLAAQVVAPESSTIVVNTTARPRAGAITFTVPGRGPLHLQAVDDGSVHAAQVVGERGGHGLDTIVTGQKVRWVLEMMRGPELAGARITRVDRQRRADGVEEFTFHDAGPGDPELDLETTRDELLALGEAGATIAIHQLRAPVRDVVAVVPDIPGFGWRTFIPVDGTPVDGEPPATKLRRTALNTNAQRRSFVFGDGRVLENEQVRVEVDAGDGTLTIETDGMRITGANRYVDGGDGGDTYNYSPPAVDRLVDRPDTVTIDTLETGPVRARLLVTSTYRWPTHAIGDEHACSARSDDVADSTVRTTLELRAGEQFLRVQVAVDHRTRDHRLRAHFPLPTTVTASHAECAFAVVERGLTAEGGPHEFGLPTFVSRRFVDAGGLALLHDGLLEYEVVDDGRELALTLLRATGYLSRSEPSLRPNPAGPLDALEGPQLQTPLTLEFAVCLHRGDWHDAGIADAADDFLVPLERVRGGGWPGASRPATGAALAIDGARPSAITRDDDGALVIRLVNLSSDDATARVDGTGQVVNLVGEPLRPFADSVALRPWEIVTLRVD